MRAALVAFLLAGACFVGAAVCAIELQQTSSALLRTHLWLGPALIAPTLEKIADVVPVEMETAPLVRKSRRVTVPAVVAAPAPLEVDPADAFRFALRSKRASFEHCYEQELKKQASFSGFIVIALSLSASGRVTDAHVQEGNRRDAVVGACIAAQLKQLRLPALTSEAELLIPIQLRAKEPS